MAKVIRIGIDPDTKATGICFQLDGCSPAFRVAAAKGRTEEHRRVGMALALATELRVIERELAQSEKAGEVAIEIAIEWQRLRPHREKNPNDMMAVQAVAGMCLLAAVAVFGHCADYHLPIPSDWRGTVPKEAKHVLWLAEARLTDTEGPLVNVPTSALSHCKCALGLVLWLRRGRTIS